jgi:hypothetical protein
MDEETIFTETIYGIKSEKPLVKIRWRKQEMMCSPDDTRKIAYDFLAAAFAAEADAFIFEWAGDVLEADTHISVGILQDFRRWREENK